MSSFSCPKCGFEPPFEVGDCPQCGVIFAKWRAAAPPTPREPVPGQAILSLGASNPVCATVAPTSASPSFAEWQERAESTRRYPVWLAFAIPVALVTAGVVTYRAVTLANIESDVLRLAKQLLEQFARGDAGPSALAKAVGRGDTTAITELKAGFAREISARGALTGVTVDDVDVDVSAEGEIAVEVHYRARAAGIRSSYQLTLAETFTPIPPEAPTASHAAPLTSGANIPYARPVVTAPSARTPRPSSFVQPPRFYQPPRLDPSPTPRPRFVSPPRPNLPASPGR